MEILMGELFARILVRIEMGEIPRYSPFKLHAR